jgi:hypothetical protein
VSSLSGRTVTLPQHSDGAHNMGSDAAVGSLRLPSRNVVIGSRQKPVSKWKAIKQAICPKNMTAREKAIRKSLALPTAPEELRCGFTERQRMSIMGVILLVLLFVGTYQLALYRPQTTRLFDQANLELVLSDFTTANHTVRPQSCRSAAPPPRRPAAPADPPPRRCVLS